MFEHLKRRAHLHLMRLPVLSFWWGCPLATPPRLHGHPCLPPSLLKGVVGDQIQRKGESTSSCDLHLLPHLKREGCLIERGAGGVPPPRCRVLTIDSTRASLLGFRRSGYRAGTIDTGCDGQHRRSQRLGHTANYFDNRSWQMPNVSSRKIVNVKCQRLRKGKCQMSGGVALRANTQMPNVSSPRIANAKCQPSKNRKCQMPAVQKSQMSNVEITGGVAQY